MPAVTAKQQRFMGACAHGAKYSGCPSAKVAHEFSHKPKGGYKGLKKAHKGKRSAVHAIMGQ